MQLILSGGDPRPSVAAQAAPGSQRVVPPVVLAGHSDLRAGSCIFVKDQFDYRGSASEKMNLRGNKHMDKLRTLQGKN